MILYGNIVIIKHLLILSYNIINKNDHKTLGIIKKTKQTTNWSIQLRCLMSRPLTVQQRRNYQTKHEQ